MEIAIILIIIYLLSVYGAYKFVQHSHYHEKGIWNNIKPHNIDLVVTFAPFANSILGIMFLMGEWKRDCYKEINFFKMKK
jgi:hypothetical protein